jgi:chromosome segregation ATPase
MDQDALFPQCKFHQDRLSKLEDAFQDVALATARIEERLANVDNKLDSLAIKVDGSHTKTEGIVLKNRETEIKVADLEQSRKEEKDKRDTLSKVLWGVASSIVVAILLTWMRLK